MLLHIAAVGKELVAYLAHVLGVRNLDVKIDLLFLMIYIVPQGKV
jgi:hypothetical protein